MKTKVEDMTEDEFIEHFSIPMTEEEYQMKLERLRNRDRKKNSE